MRRNQTILRSPLLAFFVILCLVAQSSYATIPTLETDSGALELRMADGIEANAVAFDDVWHWPDGVSAGDGDVPKDGGGTVKVSTFLTEIIAGAVYIIHKNLAFGDGSTSSWFSSLNEMVYFEDGNFWKVQSAATLDINKSSWTAANPPGSQTWGFAGSTWNVSNSKIDFGTGLNIFLFNAGTWERNVICLGEGTNLHWSNTELVMIRLTFIGGNQPITLYIVQSTRPDDIHVRDSAKGVQGQSENGVFYNLRVENTTFGATTYPESSSLNLINSSIPANVHISHDGGFIISSLTANIHISDSSGSDLQGATVVMESYGNVVKNASTFYRCLADHTAGTFATDLAAGKWIVTSAAIAAKAGVTGTDAINGLWVTGSDYEDAEELFSEVTDSEGNISQQVVNYAKWTGTSEVRHSYPPISVTVSAPSYATLRIDIAPTIIDGTVQPFVEHWQLESGATKRPRAQRHGQ